MKTLKKLTPEHFAKLFREEAPVTIAFLLSRVCNDVYVDSVLKILNNEDLDELVKSNLLDEPRNVFISSVERHIKKIVKEFRKTRSLGIFRRQVKEKTKFVLFRSTKELPATEVIKK